MSDRESIWGIPIHPPEKECATPMSELWIGSEEITEMNICFVCGKILVEGDTFQYLEKSGEHVGNICSKACVERYWEWWDKEWERLFNE